MNDSQGKLREIQTSSILGLRHSWSYWSLFSSQFLAITSWSSGCSTLRHFSVDQMPNYQIAKSEPETGPGQASTPQPRPGNNTIYNTPRYITSIIQSYTILSHPGLLGYVCYRVTSCWVTQRSNLSVKYIFAKRSIFLTLKEVQIAQKAHFLSKSFMNYPIFDQ